MNPSKFPTVLTGALCALPFIFTVSTHAQDEDLGTLVDKGLAAMNAEKWAEGLAFNTQAVERYGKNRPMQLFGPRFGVIYYRKGLCELKLKKFTPAMTSFETCYKDFPNEGTAGGNQFNKLSLLRWGEAAMGAEDWDLAIEKFQKFIKERDKIRDTFAEGVYHVNMAICYYRLGRIPEGNQSLETAIKNKERHRTPDAAIVGGFQALVVAAIDKKNEQAIIDFVEKNRGEIMIDPYAMHNFKGVFMKLAGEGIGAEMDRAALALYQLVPATEVCVEDTRIRLASIGKMRQVVDGTNILNRKTLEEDMAAVQAESRGKKTAEMVKLGAIAFVHEKHGNIRGAFAAYKQLELYHSTSEKREDNLYHLVRCASLVAPGAETQKWAELFVKDFPNSKHIPAVRRMMLSSLFADGEYALCIEVAVPMIEKLEKGTQEHDICLHVLGGSYFFTAEFDKAEPLLAQHLELYPKSPFLLAATYFQAANLSRLQYWDKAASALDAFLKKFPDADKNAFLPFALYDRANCHYAQDQHPEALTNLKRVIEEFPDAIVIDQAYNLRGNVEQALGNRDAAEQAYIKALEIATTRGTDVVAGESLYSLVALVGAEKVGKEENPRLKEAVPYADRYWKEFAEGSPYKTRMAVAQLPSMNAVGRAEEALKRVEELISEMAKDPEARGLEELVNSYTDAYLKNHSPGQLKDHYYDFPGVRGQDKAARALLRAAVIGVFDNVSRTTKNDAEKRSADAMIKVLFQQLKADFAPKDLTNFILVKLGDFLRKSTSTPREALPYYDEALSRTDQSYRFGALLGRADVYGNSTNAADVDKGIEDLTRVFADSQDKTEREFALYRTIELLMARKSYDKAAEQALVFLDRKNNNFTKYAPQVSLMLAQAYDQRNMPEDALANYLRVWSGNKGLIIVSAPAMKRWMEILWQRNKPARDERTFADRQGAYQTGAEYIEQTGRFKDKLKEEELALWKEVEALVKTYEGNPGIKTLAKLRAEKEKNRK